LPGFTNIPSRRGSSVVGEVTKQGPLGGIGDLIKSKDEYNEKLKILDEMQSELDEEEELKSVVSEEPTDVEQGRSEE
jgi:hypothetical protein